MRHGSTGKGLTIEPKLMNKQKHKSQVADTQGKVAAWPNTPIGALKIPEAGIYLGGLSKWTMHRLIDRGELRPCRGVRHILFTIEELDRWLRENQS